MGAQERTNRHYDQILWDWDARVWAYDVKTWTNDLEQLKRDAKFLLQIIHDHEQKLSKYTSEVSAYQENLYISNRAEKQMEAQGCDDFLLREAHMKVDNAHDQMKREHEQIKALHQDLVELISGQRDTIEQLNKDKPARRIH